MTTIDKLREAAGFLKPHVPSGVCAGVVLGSGLGNFVQEISVAYEVPYDAIPHFPVSTVEGHHGKLLMGTIAGRPVIALAGRFHFYEGYTAAQVVFPIRVLHLLGVQTLLISNAAGGVNPAFSVGDLMLITDHISFATVNPLLGKNEANLGPRFPDMSEPYAKDLQQKIRGLAQQHGIHLNQGVYFGVTGPTFETRAEYKLIRILGGDAVGMSTVQEVIAAVHCGMAVCAVSVITDIGIREEENQITHEEVLQAAKAAEPKLSLLFRQLITTL